jgi:AcrR family transcriptional regulator
MGTQDRRFREATARRQMILAAARPLFLKNGFTATTMPQIAAVAELAPGTLYLYYPSKIALYAELLNEGYDILIDRLRKAVKGKGAARAQATALVEAFLKFAQESPDYFDTLFFILQREGRSAAQALAPEQLAGLRQREEVCKSLAATMLAHLPAQRRPAAVEAVWTMLAGLAFFYRADPNFAAVGREAKRLLITGLFAE